MSKTGMYRKQLAALTDWDDYLMAESGLPGPRGNLELAQVVADLGSPELFHRYREISSQQAPVNSPGEFLAFCGVLGLGRLLAEGQIGFLDDLRCHASDPRWRVREAVAMALQRWGDVDLTSMVSGIQPWITGSYLEQRAAAAGMCEPRLLKQPEHARQVLEAMDRITAAMAVREDRKNEEFKALRKGLAYCWSVAVAALPEEGKPLMERWFVSPDKDVRWIMKQNLGKKRLQRVAPAWTSRWLAQL